MTKTIDTYAAHILQLHVELQHLPEYHPDYEKTQDRLSRQLSAWSKKLNITIHVASNEQTPWLEPELGYSTVPMQLKKDIHVTQVGDYMAFLEDYNQFAGILVERKGITRKNGRMVGCDLYGTFAKKDNRRRFEAEFKRYKLDPRFNRFVLIVECSHGEYLSFKPAFNGKNYNTTNFGMNVASRRATIAKLEVEGCSVFFAGTRQAAVEMYHDLVVQWVRQNYIEMLNLEE